MRRQGKRPAPRNAHERACVLFAAYFRLMGCTGVYADAPGYRKPEVILGAQANHAPALTCWRNCPSGQRSAVILDTAMMEGGSTDIAEIVSRLQLFYSAARELHGELHVVVPLLVFKKRTLGERVLRRIMRRHGVKAVARIWTL